MSELIERQAALKALRKCQPYLYDARDPELKIKLSSAKAAIKELPTIQPERKKGEWSDGYRWQRCSLCKQTGKKSWNFCPNCGADMRGEKNE